jgi:hypothetical protein
MSSVIDVYTGKSTELILALSPRAFSSFLSLLLTALYKGATLLLNVLLYQVQY